MRARVRDWIEALVHSELDAALQRPRYGRSTGGETEPAVAPVRGYRNGSRTRTLTGTFGKTDITVPRARLQGADGATTEWKSKALRAFREKAEAVSGASYNAVLLNFYRHGGDSVGWHSDSEAGLGDRPTIASLSLGGTRRFQFRHRRTKETITLELKLPPRPQYGCAIVSSGSQGWPRFSRPPKGLVLVWGFRKRGKSRGSQAVAQRCLTIAGKYGTSGWFGTARREPR